jgi:mortality factor 4-like protein 1
VSTCYVCLVSLAILPRSKPYADQIIVTMPELIAQTNMDHQAVSRLREELGQMTAWLAKDAQVNAFFASVYESPGQAYIDKVKSST